MMAVSISIGRLIGAVQGVFGEGNMAALEAA